MYICIPKKRQGAWETYRFTHALLVFILREFHCHYAVDYIGTHVFWLLTIRFAVRLTQSIQIDVDIQCWHRYWISSQSARRWNRLFQIYQWRQIHIGFTAGQWPVCLIGNRKSRPSARKHMNALDFDVKPFTKTEWCDIHTIFLVLNRWVAKYPDMHFFVRLFLAISLSARLCRYRCYISAAVLVVLPMVGFHHCYHYANYVANVIDFDRANGRGHAAQLFDTLSICHSLFIYLPLFIY